MPRQKRTMLSGRGAARYLNMAERTFRRLVDAGEIPCWVDPLTGRKRYPQMALDAWMVSLKHARAKRGAA